MSTAGGGDKMTNNPVREFVKLLHENKSNQRENRLNGISKSQEFKNAMKNLSTTNANLNALLIKVRRQNMNTINIEEDLSGYRALIRYHKELALASGAKNNPNGKKSVTPAAGGNAGAAAGGGAGAAAAGAAAASPGPAKPAAGNTNAVTITTLNANLNALKGANNNNTRAGLRKQLKANLAKYMTSSIPGSVTSNSINNNALNALISKANFTFSKQNLNKNLKTLVPNANLAEGGNNNVTVATLNNTLSAWKTSSNANKNAAFTKLKNNLIKYYKGKGNNIQISNSKLKNQLAMTNKITNKINNESFKRNISVNINQLG